MKKIILTAIITSVISFNTWASITPEQLCQEYQDGNSSLVLKKYKGKVIKDTGKIEVFYNDGNGITTPFISLSTEIKNEELNVNLSGFKNITNETEDEYINLDGQTKTISVRINDIKSEYFFGKFDCQINGDLVDFY
ncbi:hypothetical protein RHO12_07775 [Orbus sturtevantii]|uniref:hypothetical protein n=1 Tax=Orbus sturtevantii TaxID=3074109 RepID=UPI00370D8D8F